GNGEHFVLPLAVHFDVRGHAGAQLAALRVETDLDVEHAYFVVDADRRRDTVDAACEGDFRIRIERDFDRHADPNLADVNFIHACFDDHLRDVGDAEEHRAGV